jgi:hypothetical protein
MSVTGSIDNFLPNLPGYRGSKSHKGTFKKNNIFDLTNGMVVIKDAYLPTIQIPEFGEEASLSSFQIGSMSPSKRPASNPLDDPILLSFQAYFEERPIENPSQVNIRKCIMYYCVNDGTTKVVEKTKANSGTTQGTIVKKCIALRPDDSPYELADFSIGNEVSIFKRKFRYQNFQHVCAIVHS